MKKFLFSALACIAFAGSSFASNEIVKNEINLDEKSQIENSAKITNLVESDTKPCRFRITGRDVYGRSFNSPYRTVDNVTSEGCDAAKNAKVLELKEQGATIDTVESTWG